MQILSEHRAYDLHSIPYTPPPLWCHRALTQHHSGAAAASAKLVVRERETELS